MDFTIDGRAADYLARMQTFMDDAVYPAEPEYAKQRAQLIASDQPNTLPQVVEDLKVRARDAGLWNLFLPDNTEPAHGLSVLDYAPIAELSGRAIEIAPEAINCSAPDTGNMEILHMFGTAEQKERWLQPLLDGQIRSAFAMTEPDVASSDARNITTSIVREGDEFVINGRKWWTTGVNDPRCSVMIVMGKTSPDADTYHQQSMVLVPVETPGVTVVRSLPVFGYQEQHGHGEVVFDDVRVPVTNLLGDEGSGFAIAQARLGPGRIHHCMRTIGMAERALDLMAERATKRVAFGKPLARQGVVQEQIAESRIEIEQARLLTLKAAWMIDRVGAKGARTEIAAIKVAAPRAALAVIDRAIQVFGGMGVSDDVPLAAMYAGVRTLRIADGPDQVHLRDIARAELAQASGDVSTGQETVATRDEDAFDVDSLQRWLVVHAPAMTVDLSRPPLVEQFPGGASNLTYLLRYETDTGELDYVLRRPPAGHKAASAHDMRREVEVQTRLRPHYPLVPQVLAFCQDPSVIGSDFYVMERLEGSILRAQLPDGITLTAGRARELANTVIDAQADLHLLDPDSVGLGGLSRGPGYVRRQLEGWSRRFREARTDDVPDGESVMAWLAAHQPDDVAQRVIHGDWRFDNLVLDLAEPPRVVGVLDWEMATVGDPLMDLGASLAYWVEAGDDADFQLMRRQPSNLPGMPTRAEYVERYVSRTGLAVDDFAFYEVYGLFRLAVIAQQIWYRYVRGETHNPAFKVFGVGATTLVNRATALAMP